MQKIGPLWTTQKLWKLRSWRAANVYCQKVACLAKKKPRLCGQMEGAPREVYDGFTDKIFRPWIFWQACKLFKSWKLCVRRKIKYSDLEYFDGGLPINKIAPTKRVRWEIKRACNGSNKQETLVGVSGSWLLLIKRCLAKSSLQSNQKTKANDFVTRVANKKRHLRSSQRLSWSSRMGWQVVSTTIFEWLLNLRLKLWTNYRVVTADNLLMKDKPSIKAPSVTCFGLITCQMKVRQLETGCPLSIKSWS